MHRAYGEEYILLFNTTGENNKYISAWRANSKAIDVYKDDRINNTISGWNRVHVGIGWYRAVVILQCRVTTFYSVGILFNLCNSDSGFGATFFTHLKNLVHTFSYTLPRHRETNS